MNNEPLDNEQCDEAFHFVHAGVPGVALGDGDPLSLPFRAILGQAKGHALQEIFRRRRQVDHVTQFPRLWMSGADDGQTGGQVFVEFELCTSFWTLEC